MSRFAIYPLVLSLLLPAPAIADAIHEAAKKGDIATIASELDAGGFVDEDDGSGTPLYLAVRRDNLAAAELLIERGADVNSATRNGPVLLVAAAKGNSRMIKLLIEHGADPNSQQDGDTALLVAVELGCVDCVKELVSAGADVNARTSDGKTPLHQARRVGNREIADYLMENGVRLPVPHQISGMLAGADIEKGGEYFRNVCGSCHSNAPEASQKHGPNLWGVVGRRKASVEQYGYSETLRAWGGLWTYEDLNVFLSGPMLTTPGTYMEADGAPEDGDRANVIAYLRTLAYQPEPLP